MTDIAVLSEVLFDLKKLDLLYGGG